MTMNSTSASSSPAAETPTSPRRKNSFTSPSAATSERGLRISPRRSNSGNGNNGATSPTSRRSTSLIRTPADVEIFDQMASSTQVSLRAASRNQQRKNNTNSSVSSAQDGIHGAVDHFMENAYHIMRSCSPVSDDDNTSQIVLDTCGKTSSRLFGQPSVQTPERYDPLHNFWDGYHNEGSDARQQPADAATTTRPNNLDLRHNDDTFHVLASLLVEFFQAKVVGRTLVLLPEDKDTVSRMVPPSAVTDFIDAVQYRLEMTPIVQVSPIQFLTLQCQELCLDRTHPLENPILASFQLQQDPITMQVLSVLDDISYRYREYGEDEDLNENQVVGAVTETVAPAAAGTMVHNRTDNAALHHDVLSLLRDDDDSMDVSNEDVLLRDGDIADGFDLNTIPYYTSSSSSSSSGTTLNSMVHVATSRDIAEEMKLLETAEDKGEEHTGASAAIGLTAPLEADSSLPANKNVARQESSTTVDATKAAVENDEDSVVLVQHSDATDKNDVKEEGEEKLLDDDSEEIVNVPESQPTTNSDDNNDIKAETEPAPLKSSNLHDNLATDAVSAATAAAFKETVEEGKEVLLQEVAETVAAPAHFNQDSSAFVDASTDFKASITAGPDSGTSHDVAAKTREVPCTNEGRGEDELLRTSNPGAAPNDPAVHEAVEETEVRSRSDETKKRDEKPSKVGMTDKDEMESQNRSAKTEKIVNRGSAFEHIKEARALPQPSGDDVAQGDGMDGRDASDSIQGTAPAEPTEGQDKAPKDESKVEAAAAEATNGDTNDGPATKDPAVKSIKKKSKNKSDGDSVTRRMQTAADSFFADLRAAVDAQVTNLQGNLMDAIKTKSNAHQTTDEDTATFASSVARNDTTTLSPFGPLLSNDDVATVDALDSLVTKSATQETDLPLPEVSIATHSEPVSNDKQQDLALSPDIRPFFGILVAGLLPPIVDGVSVTGETTSSGKPINQTRESNVVPPSTEIVPFVEQQASEAPAAQDSEIELPNITTLDIVPTTSNGALSSQEGRYHGANDTTMQQLLAELHEARQLMEHSLTPETTRFWEDHVRTLQSRIEEFGADGPLFDKEDLAAESKDLAFQPDRLQPKVPNQPRPPTEEGNDGYEPLHDAEANVPHSSREDKMDDALPTQYHIPKVDVVAPADLPGGYHFEAEIEGQRFLATVPPGGVQQGETFTCLMRELDSVAIDIPVGYWKDGLCNICELGWYHPVVWCSIFCPLVTLGQIQTRIQLDFLGRPRFGEQQPSSMSTRSMMLSLIFFWAFTNIGLFAACNLKWSRGLELSVADIFAFALVNIVMFGFIIFVTQSTRSSLREKFMIREERCFDLEDICCATACLPCTVGQMARHTANYDDYEAVCCSKTGLPNGVRVNRAQDSDGYIV